ncbi:MAG TPA: C10 family peptidase [bacterium]|nr:C10 family peptidase [bacterium]
MAVDLVLLEIYQLSEMVSMNILNPLTQVGTLNISVANANEAMWNSIISGASPLSAQQRITTYYFRVEHNIFIPLEDVSIDEPVRVDSILGKNNWIQGGFFNDYLENAAHAYYPIIGCTQLSAAQIMKKWNYPSTMNVDLTYIDDENVGSGEAIYVNDGRFVCPDIGKKAPYDNDPTIDWGSILPFYDRMDHWASVCYSPTCNAAKRYLYNVAILFCPDFGSEATSNPIARSLSVMPQFFRYSKDIASMPADDPLKISNIKRQMILGVPVQGETDGDDGDSGHAFVVDGFDDTDSDNIKIHVNLGWHWPKDTRFWVNANDALGHDSGQGPLQSIIYNIFPETYCGNDQYAEECNDKDGVPFYKDKCPRVYNPENSNIYYCKDKDRDGFCEQPDVLVQSDCSWSCINWVKANYYMEIDYSSVNYTSAPFKKGKTYKTNNQIDVEVREIEDWPNTKKAKIYVSSKDFLLGFQLTGIYSSEGNYMGHIDAVERICNPEEGVEISGERFLFAKETYDDGQIKTSRNRPSDNCPSVYNPDQHINSLVSGMVGTACDIDKNGIDDTTQFDLFYVEGQNALSYSESTSSTSSSCGSFSFPGTCFNVTAEEGAVSEVTGTNKIMDKNHPASPEMYGAVYYCLCGTEKNEKWRECRHNSVEGKCGINMASPAGSPFDKEKNLYKWRPASTDKSWDLFRGTKNNRLITKDITWSQHPTGAFTKGYSEKWYWQTDMEREGLNASQWYREFPYTDPQPPYNTYLRSSQYMDDYYAIFPTVMLSFSPVTTSQTDKYVLDANGRPVSETQTAWANYNDTNFPDVNAGYFKNSRGNFSTNRFYPAIAHTVKEANLLHSKISFLRFIPFDTPFKLHDTLLEQLMEGHWLDDPSGPVQDIPIQDEPWGRPGLVFDTQFDLAGDNILLKKLRLPNGWMSFVLTQGGGFSSYVKNADGTYALKTIDSTGNMESAFAISGGSDFYFGAMSKKGENYYLAGNLQVTGFVTTAGYAYTLGSKFGKLSPTDTSGYAFSQLADLPSPSTSLKLFSHNDVLYAIQSVDTENPKAVKIAKYNEGENLWEIVARIETTESVVVKSVIPQTTTVYFLVNGTTSKVYEYNPALTENNVIERATLLASNVRMYDNSGLFVALNLETLKAPPVMAYNISAEGLVEEREVIIEGYNFDISSTVTNSYCLHEVAGTLKGGVEGNLACQPFTHPWYKSFSIGTTVYSVAGKGDRLYVGTSNAIKVYDISDPNALTLKSTFTTNKIVYDLEVVDGDIMYAATSKGLYKLSTANPDTLSIIGSFYSTGSYNYQYRIQLYNDKLYVGDDNGINIRDKETFTRLAYVNIGSTLDFAIANGELAMYWDDFWVSGLDIRDADTLTRKAWENPYCSTGELTTDHGAFYLSCDGYEYRFAGRPDTYIDFWELSGDIREMAENHLYNGWVYIPDGNKVKVSTNNEVSSYCGNGIVEPGEVCDGNSVYCEDLDPNEWNSGTATCKSDCSGYNTGDCYWSGC